MTGQTTGDALLAQTASRLKIALRAAEQAGAVLMAHLGKLKGYDQKSAVDLVTEADRASERCILSELRGSFGGDTFLAEEGDGKAGAAALRDRVAGLPWCWVVDPLDGTTNFAHGHLQFAVSIGLLRFGEPWFGVVLAPARREVFVGGQGIAATLNGAPIQVSRTATLDRSLIATGFPYDRRERLDALLAWLGRALMRVQCVRRAGSAALDLCDVAAGRLDGFYEPGLQPWDTCAGHAIVAAAGGRLSDFGGGPHDLFGGWTVATNGRIHDQLLDTVTRPPVA